MAIKFFQHYAYVAAAMKHMGDRGYQLWDEQDGFFYDVLRYPNGGFHKFRVRSLVGLIPLFAVERLEATGSSRSTSSAAAFHWFLRQPPRPGAATSSTKSAKATSKTYVLTILDEDQLPRDLRARLRRR